MPSEIPADAEATPVGPSPRLEILKALGDNTRYAIYLELARSPRRLSTAEISATLGLHVNTVRPHLERMRDVGLLDVTSESRRGVGRPHHLYALTAEAPSLGLEPPTFPLLSGLLLRLIDQAGLGADEAVEVGREHGGVTAGLRGAETDAIALVLAEQADLGFDPERLDTDRGTTIAFGHCPYGDLARHHSEVVCGLHCGMIEGLVEASTGTRVVSFHTLAHRNPCQVELAVTG